MRRIKSTQTQVNLMIRLRTGQEDGKKWSYPRIATRLGHKDHTSVMYWLKRFVKEGAIPRVSKGSGPTKQERAAEAKFKHQKPPRMKGSSIPPKMHTPVFGPFKKERQIVIKEDRGKSYAEIIGEQTRKKDQKGCSHTGRFRNACLACGKLLTSATKSVVT